MSKLQNIVTGWSKSMGLMTVSPEEKKLSIARMTKCATCPFAKKSSFLAILHGKGHNLAAIYCGQCGCPVNEKSLVKNETCPVGSWDNIE
jgi:hypothetical protein